MNERLILMDGTEIPNSHALKVNRGQLFLYIQDPEATFAGVFEMLMRPEKTGKIWAIEAGAPDPAEYTGFTELISLRKEDEGQITAILAKADA